MPILDGSSRRFVTRLIAAGTRQQDRPVRVLRVLKPVEVRKGDAWARLEPADGFEIRFHIDFSDEAIGAQDLSLNMANGSFVRELSDCRTFCRQADVDAMRANGLALGGTLENAVVFDGGDEVLSPPGGGLRRADEPVRHKMLDALGDLYTAGAPILGRYVGHKAGHAMTNALLRALFEDDDNWSLDVSDAQTARHLPGVVWARMTCRFQPETRRVFGPSGGAANRKQPQKPAIDHFARNFSVLVSLQSGAAWTAWEWIDGGVGAT